jgi:hypothetical protein
MLHTAFRTRRLVFSVLALVALAVTALGFAVPIYSEPANPVCSASPVIRRALISGNSKASLHLEALQAEEQASTEFCATSTQATYRLYAL